MATRPKQYPIEAVYRGEAVDQPFQIIDPSTTNIAGWTIAAQLKTERGVASPVLATPSVAKTGATSFTVSLTSSHTDREPGGYYLEVWRTDVGYEQLLAETKLTILSDLRF